MSEQRSQSLGKSLPTHYGTILKHCTNGAPPKGFCDVLREKQGEDRLNLSSCVAVEESADDD
jgi:hypothetical protein